jgi:hypothetical protein
VIEDGLGVFGLWLAAEVAGFEDEAAGFGEVVPARRARRRFECPFFSVESHLVCPIAKTTSTTPPYPERGARSSYARDARVQRPGQSRRQ